MNSRKFFYDATPNSFEKAKWLRNKSTRHGEMLWECLRKKQIFGLRIRRQHPIGQYITDFYCHRAKLVIEVDGDAHGSPEQSHHDQERSFSLSLDGIKVIRFSNTEVEENLRTVVEEITKNVRERIRLK